MALPVWKANGAALSGTGAITPLAPTGHAVGDFLVLAVNSSNQAVATPTGWTAFPSPNGTGTGTAATADSCALYLFYKFATTTSESAVLADSGDHTLGVITSFTGVDTVNPLDTAAIAWTTKAANSTADTFPTVTTSGPDRLVVTAIATGQESVKSSPTFAGLGSFTARASGTTLSGVDGGIAMFSGTKVAAGSTGTGSVTESITSKAISATFALAPVSVTILDDLLPRFGAVGRAYGWNIAALGGPTSFTVTTGALPTGVTVDSSGQVTGTATTAGTYTGVITASDGVTSSTLSFSIKILATAPLNLDAQTFTYTGTDGAAGRVLRVNGIDLSGGGILHVIQRRLGSESTRVGYVYASPTGGTSGKRWNLNNEGSAAGEAASNVTLSNGTITLPADLNEAGRKYVMVAFKKAAGVADVVTYTGSGGSQNVAHALGYVPLLLFSKTSAGNVGTGNRTVFNQYGYVGRWGSNGFWASSGATDIYSNTNSTTDVGVTGTLNTAATSYTLGMIADNPEVAKSGFIYSQVSGAPIASNSKVANLWWASKNNVGSVTPHHVPRDLQTNYIFDSSADVHGYFAGAADPADTNFVSDTSGSSGVNIMGTAAQYNYPGQVGLWTIFVEGGVNYTIAPNGIASAQAFGSPTVSITGLQIKHDATDGNNGQYHRISFLGFGGTDPVTFTILSGSVPAGMTLETTGANTAEIRGTPTTNATYTFTVRAVDGLGVTRDTALTIKIVAAPVAIETLFEQFTYVGDGDYATALKTISLAVDITAGGMVHITGRNGSSTEVGTWAVVGGTFYREARGTNELAITASGEAITSTALTFLKNYAGSGNGFNESGWTYLVSVFKTSSNFFDLIRFTANNTGARTLSHGLGGTPEALWIVDSAGASAPAYLKGFPANTSAFIDDRPSNPRDTFYTFFSTLPTTTQLTLGSNGNDTSYCGSGPRFIALLGRGTTDTTTPAAAVVLAGSYTGDGAASRSDALVPGWRVQSAHIFGQNTYSIAFHSPQNTRNWAGSDTYWTANTVNSGSDVVSESAKGINYDAAGITSKTNAVGTAYDYLAIRQPYIAPQFVSPTGIASSEAFGSLTILQISPQIIVPVGIASAQAFGSPTIVPGGTTVTVTGIASAQAFGVPTVQPGAVTITPTGIASGQAMGSPTIVVGTATIAPTGIASEEVFGSPLVSVAGGGTQIAIPVGIVSSEAVGSPTITTTITAQVTGIASTEAFGSPTLLRGAVTVAPVGIASAEALGSPTLFRGAVSVAPASIGSAEAFGTPTLIQQQFLIPAGIASAEAFGTAAITTGAVSVSPAAIASTEVFGTTTASSLATVLPTAVATSEAFGAPSVTAGNVSVAPSAIASGEAFGALSASGVATVSPTAIASAQTFGAPVVSTGAVTVLLTAIASAEAFGAPTATALSVIAPASIAAAESVGAPTVTSIASVLPTGVATAEAFGAPTIGALNVISPAAIASSGAFGTPSVSTAGVSVAPDAIASTETFGAPVITATASISLAAIDTDETFGTSALSSLAYVAPTSIASAESVGAITVSTGAVDVAPASIDSSEAFGALVATAGVASIQPVGIASAETFGPVLFYANYPVATTAIPGAEAFGSPTITAAATISPVSISTGEVVSPIAVTIAGVIATAAIASVETFGTPQLTTTVAVTAASIATTEAFGTPTVVGASLVMPASSASSEAFGVPTIAIIARVSPAPIASAESFGTPTLFWQQFVSLQAIASTEAFGAPVVSAGAIVVAPVSINGDEALGEPTLSARSQIIPSAIASVEVVSAVTLIPGEVLLVVSGINSAEAFGVVYIGGGRRPQPPVHTVRPGIDPNATTLRGGGTTAVALQPRGGTAQALQPSSDPVALRPPAKKLTTLR